MMSLVRQPPETYYCQACCVAMLAGVTLDDVLSSARLLEAPDKSGKTYLSNLDAQKFLIGRGLSLGAITNFEPQRVDLDRLVIHDVRRIAALVGVESHVYAGGMHAVVWCPDRQMVLDPQRDDPQPIDRYMVYEWMPLTRWLD